MLHYFPLCARCYYDASVSLGLDAKEFDARLAAIEAKVAGASKGMSKSLGGISLGGLAGLLGGLVSVGSIAAAAKGIIDYAANVQDLSTRFGVSTDAIQHFGNAAEKNGSSLESMTMGFNKLEISRSKALQGDQELIGSFARLGISIVDLKKLNPEELMKKLGASSLNAAETVKILGKNALELRPTLAGIADGTIEIGDAINAIDIQKLKDADTEWKKLFETLRIVGASTLVTIRDSFKEVGGAIADATSKFRDFITSGPLGVKARKGPAYVGADGDVNVKTKAGVQVAGGPKEGRPGFGQEQDETDMRRADATKFTLAELAGRDSSDYSQSVHRGKYIGDDIAKAKEAEREKGLADDALFAGNKDEAQLHSQRYESLTSGIGSLKSTEKNPLTAKVDEIATTAQKIEKNTAKPFVNH